MKQPELGQKIVELRQRKGLTQEELVEQCNISVRTIQRIEAGEVTPRSYTVKTILNALDYDLEQLQYAENKATKEFKKLFLLDIDGQKEAGFLTLQLNIAWISGLVYFLLSFFEAYLDFSRLYDDTLVFGKAGNIIIKLLILTSFILFARGFVLAGKIFKIYLLKISAFILIFISAVYYIYDIASIYTEAFDTDFVIGAASLTYGIGGIFFGIALFRLQNVIGILASISGVFELISAFFFLTVILGWLGLIFIIPTVLLQVVLLYKILSLLKSKQKEIAEA